MNATAKLVATVLVPGLLALAVAMGQTQGERGIAGSNNGAHLQQNPCDLIPLQLACKPSGFDLVGYCGAQCLDPAVNGKRCVIDVIWFSNVIAPDAIAVESWWIIRSMTDGRSPTPDPGWPVEKYPQFCTKALSLPIVISGLGGATATATFVP